MARGVGGLTNKAMYSTLSLCSMLRRSYTRTDAFDLSAGYSCSITSSYMRANNANNLPPVAVVMAYGDKIVADLACTLRWIQKKHE